MGFDEDAFLKMVAERQNRVDKKAFEKLGQILGGVNPEETAALLCGFAARPELQSNFCRITTLIHAALVFGSSGKGNIKVAIKQAFDLLSDASPGRDEDPAEDVFLLHVIYNEEMYRVFPGQWEGGDFFLRLFLEVVERLPRTPLFSDIQESIQALLRLSEIVAERSGVSSNTIGAQYPLDSIPQKLFDHAAAIQGVVEFSPEEILGHGMNIESLKPFILNANRANTFSFPLHGLLTDLCKHPIVLKESGHFFLFPQGVVSGIRHQVLSKYADKREVTIEFIKAYDRLFRRHQFLGSLPQAPPLQPEPIEDSELLKSELRIGITEYKALHVIFLLDPIQTCTQSDWNTHEPAFVPSEKVQELIAIARKQMTEQNFLEGTTILSFAGWGRPLFADAPLEEYDNWSVRQVMPHDLIHLGEHPEMNDALYWKTLRLERLFQANGGQLFNVNGALNLLGWLIRQRWHIVPHEDLPQESRNESPLIVVPTDCIADVRQKARVAHETFSVVDFDGNELLVTRFSGGQHYFAEDAAIPLFASGEEAENGRLVGVYIGEVANWFCRLIPLKRSPEQFKLWDAALQILSRADSVLIQLHKNIPSIVEWKLAVFSEEDSIEPSGQIQSERIESGRVETKIRIGENSHFRREDNAGEKMLMRSFLLCLDDSLKHHLDTIERLVFPDAYSKHLHLFPAQTYSDLVSAHLPGPILIDSIDDASTRIGLGATSGKFLRIEGREECTSYLQELTDHVWESISLELKKFSREEICQKLLLNIESLAASKRHWERTTRSVLSFHQDRDATSKVISDEISKVNAARLASRILTEMAICTCPSDVSKLPDDIDLSFLLAKAMLLFHIGSWSDAIHQGLYMPEIHVSVHGQLMMNYEFEDSVMNPYFSELNARQRDGNARSYSKIYQILRPSDLEDTLNSFEESFMEAWRQEFGMTVKSSLEIATVLEDWGIERDTPVYIEDRSRLISNLVSSAQLCAGDDLEFFVSRLTLPIRESWNQATDKGKLRVAPEDWIPWHFRRKLSVLSRPILEVECEPDSRLMISPGHIRESVAYLFENSYKANFDEKYFQTRSMRKWIGSRRNKTGTDFNTEVSETLQEIGWRTEPNLKITTLLNKKTSKDYGDIDVLAWSAHHSAVVAIECKDLHFAKTYREIGNQINDFKGVLNARGKPDRLFKHFNRLDIVVKYMDRVAKYCGFTEQPTLFGMVVLSQRSVLEYAVDLPKNRIFFCAIENFKEPEAMLRHMPKWLS